MAPTLWRDNAIILAQAPRNSLWKCEHAFIPEMESQCSRIVPHGLAAEVFYYEIFKVHTDRGKQTWPLIILQLSWGVSKKKQNICLKYYSMLHVCFWKYTSPPTPMQTHTYSSSGPPWGILRAHFLAWSAENRAQKWRLKDVETLRTTDLLATEFDSSIIPQIMYI